MTESTGDVPGRIFMSYRREDTAYPAGWLYERLASHFGRSQVFKDIDSIELGDDFVEVITAAVGSCDVLLALIGDRWLTVTSQDGRRRLDNPNDFVRLEIETALTRTVRVIPILVEGARMPREDELPASLAKLARRQALELSPSRFDADTERLLGVLGRTISEAHEQARQRAEEEAARQRRLVELQGQIRERTAARDWEAVVAASGELAALDSAASNLDSPASMAHEQITRRQEAEERARQAVIDGPSESSSQIGEAASRTKHAPPGGAVRGNPFTYGNPISDPRRFFGRAREVEQIFGRLRNEEFESSSVVGERRIGKTSLLNYLADPSVRARYDLGPERYTFVYVDLQMVDDTMSPEQLWRRLLLLMQRQCTNHEIAELLTTLGRSDRLDAFDLDELFQEIDDKGLRVVFLLDEFERVTENANFGPDFYYRLRSLIIHHKLALITSSRRELIELCHSEAIRSSPFFNIFANINLRVFSQADFQLMVSQSLNETPIRFSETDIGHVLDLAGLHPYFLQAACCMLYEAHRMNVAETARAAFLVERFRAEAIPQIVDYWNNSGDYQKIVLTAAAMFERAAKSTRGFSLSELQGVFSRSGPSVEQLEKRGLLTSSESRYRLFSSVLGPWILQQITAELSEENTYREWLAENRSVEQTVGKQGGPLREVLPKIGARYRKLIVIWASDPQTLAAMASLLKTVLALVN